eukprot:jgi/Picsp_1/718/NSC_04207-R1_udp-galactose transporter 6
MTMEGPFSTPSPVRNKGTFGTASTTSKSFPAYEDEKKQTGQLKPIYKIWLVCGDCFLIGLAPVLVHMAKDSEGKYAFSPVSVNLLVEIVKTVFALGTLIVYGSGRPGPPLYKSVKAFWKDAHHNRLLAIPAGLYAINNYLKFAMQLYFKPTTAKMLSNLKIIVIALLMRSVMRRSFSVFQWEALFLLVAGITVNQLSSCDGSKYADILSPVALLYTLGSITIPSLASVYNEFGFKKNMETSVLLQNFFLYFYGACFNMCGAFFMSVFMPGSTVTGLFTGFRTITFAIVINNAMQGILSSFFFKFADTILKKYSSTIATIFTGLMSAALFGHPITMNFLIGVSIVFISMHLFFSLGGTKGPSAQPKSQIKASPSLHVSPSMDHLNIASSSRGAGEYMTLAGDMTREHESTSLLSSRGSSQILPR